MLLNTTKKILLATIIFIFVFVFVSTPAANNNRAMADEGSQNKIRVIYFYSADCQNCQKIKPFIEQVKRDYKDRIDFLQHDVKDKEECRQLFFNFIKAYNLSEEKAKVPIVFAGKDYLLGADAIENNLREKIDQKIKDNENLLFDCHKFLENWPNVENIDFNESGAGTVCNADFKTDYCSIGGNSNSDTENQDMHKKLSLGLIMITAAIDSINPCAIAALIFLLAILVSVKSSKRKIVKIGLIYISAVFISYYLAGLGLMKIITQFDIAFQVRIIAGLIVLLAGLLEIKEGLCPDGKQLLVIPPKTKSLFTGLLKKMTIPSVFLAGILVSAFELPCTGQVYLGILSILSQENLKAEGYLYLLVYNFIFVLPLIIIVIIAAWGFDVKRMETMRKEARATVKILIGIVMVLLGIFLLFQSQVIGLLGI